MTDRTNPPQICRGWIVKERDSPWHFVVLGRDTERRFVLEPVMRDPTATYWDIVPQGQGLRGAVRKRRTRHGSIGRPGTNHKYIAVENHKGSPVNSYAYLQDPELNRPDAFGANGARYLDTLLMEYPDQIAATIWTTTTTEPGDTQLKSLGLRLMYHATEARQSPEDIARAYLIPTTMIHRAFMGSVKSPVLYHLVAYVLGVRFSTVTRAAGIRWTGDEVPYTPGRPEPLGMLDTPAR